MKPLYKLLALVAGAGLALVITSSYGTRYMEPDVWFFRLSYKCNGERGKIVQHLSGGNLNFICQQKLYANNNHLIQGCRTLTITESFCGRE